MKNYLIAIFLAASLVLISSVLKAAPIDPGMYPDSTINCTMPTEREDGTPLSPDEIAGIKWYWGNAPGDYQMSSPDLIPVCQYTHPNIPNTTTYFVGTVIDTDGRESRYSMPEVVLEVGGVVADPKPMTGITITPNKAQP